MGKISSPCTPARRQPAAYGVEQSIGTSKAHPPLVRSAVGTADLAMHDLTLFVDEQAQDQDDVLAVTQPLEIRRPDHAHGPTQGTRPYSQPLLR